jgi:hypothetical protein
MERRYSKSKDSRELAFAGQEFLFCFSDDSIIPPKSQYWALRMQSLKRMDAI